MQFFGMKNYLAMVFHLTISNQNQNSNTELIKFTFFLHKTNKYEHFNVNFISIYFSNDRLLLQEIKWIY